MNKIKEYFKWYKDILAHPLYFILNNMTKSDYDERIRLYEVLERKGGPGKVPPDDEDHKAFIEHLDNEKYGPFGWFAR